MQCRWMRTIVLVGVLCAWQAGLPDAEAQNRVRIAPAREQHQIDPIDEFANPTVSVAEDEADNWTPRRAAKASRYDQREGRHDSEPAASRGRAKRSPAVRAASNRARERDFYYEDFAEQEQVEPASYNDGYYDPTVRGNTDMPSRDVRDQDYVEYDHEYGVRYRPYRVARTSYHDRLPAGENYEEVAPPGDWEGDYQSNYNDEFDPYAPGAMDGGYYEQPYGGGCRSDGCGARRCGGGCGCGHDCGGICGTPLYDDTHNKSFGLWAQADYLLWWTKGNALPPLVTTSPDETPRVQAGVLGQPGTEILYGNERYLNDSRNGGRLDFGAWINPRRSVGIGGGFFTLENATSSFSAASAGEPILARPFFNANTGVQDSALVAYTSTLTGDIVAGDITATTSNSLVNANAYMTGMLYREYGVRYDLLGGYRFTRFDEDVTVTDNLVITEQGGFAPQGTTFNTLDSFDITNEFNGGELGLLFESTSGRWSLDGAFKIALGNMHQTANVWGRTIVTVPNSAPDAREGGLLALPSNIGFYSQNQFAVVPEARFDLSYHITTWWRIQAGYTFIYWNNVVRAGHQIDTTLNTTQLDPAPVGPDRPAFSFVKGDLWAQGLNVGTELRY